MWPIVITIAAIAFAYWFLNRSTRIFSSSANLPTTATPLSGPVKAKQKSVPRPTVDLSAREPVVLYASLTGTSKKAAQKLVDDVKELFGLSFRLESLSTYE